MNITAIFAHPDDETYGPGGTLAHYAKNGHQVNLIILTRGEAGSLGICKEMEPKDIAIMRTKELKCATKALGIQNLQMYDLPDKHLKDFPDAEGIQIVKNEIIKNQTDVLITFHHLGLSGHLDHLAVTQWCVTAISQMENPPAFFQYGISQALAKSLAPHRKLIPFLDDEQTHRVDISTTITEKRKAIFCHDSQLGLWQIFDSVDRAADYFLVEESFMQVNPERETDFLDDSLLDISVN